jgi:hypothetical protein
MSSNQAKTRISLARLRKIDPEVVNLTDKELTEVRDAFYELGDLIFEDWCEQKFDSKFPIGDNNSHKEKGKI